MQPGISDRLDSPACFAAILGGSQHGCWLPPVAQAVSSRRSCRGDALVLEPDYRGMDDAVTIVDVTASPDGDQVVRIVRLCSAAAAGCRCAWNSVPDSDTADARRH
jgi:hypothetical protein